MNALLEMSVEATLVILVALAAGFALRHRSAALRHWLLAVALVCAVATPLLGSLVPSWSATLFTGETSPGRIAAAPIPNSQAANSQSANAQTTWELRSRALEVEVDAIASTGWASRVASGIVPVWLAGVGVSLLTLIVGLVRLTWMASQADPIHHQQWTRAAAEISRAYGLRRPVLLLRSAHPTLLVTWGLRQPKVILPAAALGWTSDRIRIVLAHELAHVRRCDWLLQLTVQLLRAAHWFNPLVWVAASRLRQESEQACDDVVINLGIDASAYATHLLELARAFNHERRTWSPAPAIARPSSLERRVRAMLNTRANRAPISRTASFTASGALLAVAIVVAGFTASAQTFSTVSGSIVDPQGALLPGVSVVLTNAQTEAKYEVRTTRTGQFEFVGIPAGDFTLTARLPGFRTLEERVTVSGRNLQRDLALQIGTLQETITVTPGPARRAASAVDVDAVRAAFREAAARCGASSSNAGPAVGGNIRPPRKIRHVAPDYPEGLQQAGIGGTVNLDALIGVDGRVRQVEPEANQSVDPGLVSAAIDAVNQWEFDGTLLNCVPVEVQMDVAVYFRP